MKERISIEKASYKHKIVTQRAKKLQKVAEFLADPSGKSLDKTEALKVLYKKLVKPRPELFPKIDVKTVKPKNNKICPRCGEDFKGNNSSKLLGTGSS